MKYRICLLLLFLVSACTRINPPTGPDNQPWYYLDFTGYGESLVPGYLKIFSDSSWQEYAGIDTVNGAGYISILSSDSSLAFYTPAAGQYAGFKIPGQDPVIFDAPLPFLPTRWPSDSTFARTATFAVNGYSVSVTDFYTLIDTGGVASPVGNFSPVPHFEDDTYIQVSDGETGYASQDIWTARGPGVILTEQQGEPGIYFSRGFVNGKSWGSAAPARTTIVEGSSTRLWLKEMIRKSRTGATGMYHAIR